MKDEHSIIRTARETLLAEHEEVTPATLEERVKTLLYSFTVKMI